MTQYHLRLSWGKSLQTDDLRRIFFLPLFLFGEACSHLVACKATPSRCPRCNAISIVFVPHISQ